MKPLKVQAANLWSLEPASYTSSVSGPRHEKDIFDLKSGTDDSRIIMNI